MTTYFVRKTGNDTTGTGSTAAPWLTVAKAFTVLTTGDILKIGAGIYAEDNGSGYLTLGTAYGGGRVIVAPESGRKDVILTGTTGAYAVAIGSTSNLWFDQIVIQSQLPANQAALRLTGNCYNITFTRCDLVAYADPAGNRLCIASAWTTAATVHDILFSSCQFSQIGYETCSGGIIDGGIAGGVTALEFRNCTFELSNYCMRVQGVTDFKMTGCRLDSFGLLSGATTMTLGVDGATGVFTSGEIVGNEIRTHTGHGLVVGAGCDGVRVLDNHIHGGNNAGAGQGLVMKNCINTRFQRNTVYSGNLSGAYFKAANNCQFFDNIVVNRYAASSALRIGVNPENNSLCYNLNVKGNTFIALVGAIFDIGGPSEDSGGSEVDSNIYVVQSPAVLGKIRGATVTNRTEMRAAWSAYDKPNNDRNSKIGSNASIHPTQNVLLPA